LINTQKGEEKLNKVIKKAAFILICAVIYSISCGVFSVSAAEDVNDMGTRVISNVNKIWTVKFKSPVDIDSLNNSVSIRDVTGGADVDISISAGEDENSASINPPSGGYKLSHNYTLTIDKSAKSKSGQSLPKSVILSFNVASKDNNGYTASANITVSPVLPIFKQINVSTDLPSAAKYKIEGNNNLFDVGSNMVLFASQDTVKVYLYDNKQNLLGTSTLDVSATKNNISMNITLAD